MTHPETERPTRSAASLISASCASLRRTRKNDDFFTSAALRGRPAVRFFAAMRTNVPQKYPQSRTLFCLLPWY